MIEKRRLFLLDQVLEDADIFGFRNLDSESLAPVIQQDAVEREEFCWVRSCSWR